VAGDQVRQRLHRAYKKRLDWGALQPWGPRLKNKGKYRSLASYGLMEVAPQHVFAS
jgi:hypothetical protein